MSYQPGYAGGVNVFSAQFEKAESAKQTIRTAGTDLSKLAKTLKTSYEKETMSVLDPSSDILDSKVNEILDDMEELSKALLVMASLFEASIRTARNTQNELTKKMEG